jgi:hypothetical protein
MNHPEPVRLCTGSVRVGCVHASSLRPVQMPADVFQKISAASSSAMPYAPAHHGTTQSSLHNLP